MTSNVQNIVPYLPNARKFPRDLTQLQEEVGKAYIDIATSVNSREIAKYDMTPLITGQTWPGTNASNASVKRQSLRQVYSISDGSLTFNHGIVGFTAIVNIRGVFTDGTYWYDIPYVDVTNVNNQIAVKVSSTQVIINKGSGSPPAISSGYLILEWLAS